MVDGGREAEVDGGREAEIAGGHKVEGGGLLEGKRLLITGVLTKGSIAYTVAERAQQQGAQVVLTGFGRTRRMTERSAVRLPDPPTC